MERRTAEARRKMVPANRLAKGRTTAAPAGIAMSPVTILHHPYEEYEDDESARQTPGEVLAEDAGVCFPDPVRDDPPCTREKGVVNPVVHAVQNVQSIRPDPGQP